MNSGDLLAVRSDGATLHYDGDDEFGRPQGHIRVGDKDYDPRPVAALVARGQWSSPDGITAAVRHVRTPEGAARYGQPIGSVITADRVPKANLTKALPDGMTMEQYLTPHTVPTPKAVLSEQQPIGFERAWLSGDEATKEINETIKRTVRQIWPDVTDMHIQDSGSDGRVSLKIRGTTFGRRQEGLNPWSLRIGVQRKVDPLAGTVYNEYFKVDESHQGYGFAAALTANLEDLYRRRGVISIKVSANIDVGGYAWAKLGFDFKIPGQGRAFLQQMKGRTSDKEIRHQINALLERDRRGDPVTPIELAMIGYDQRQVIGDHEDWFGKEFMLGTSWGGSRILYAEDPRVDALTDDEWKSLLEPLLERAYPVEVDLTPVISKIKEKVHEGVTLEQMVAADIIRDEINKQRDDAIEEVESQRRSEDPVDQLLRTPLWATSLLPAMQADREGSLLSNFLNELRAGQRQPLDGFAARAWSSEEHKWSLVTKAADDIRAALYVEPMEAGSSPGLRVKMVLSDEVVSGNLYMARRVKTAVVDGFGDWLSDVRRRYGVSEVHVTGVTPEWLRTNLNLRGYSVDMDDTGLIRMISGRAQTHIYKDWIIEEDATGAATFRRMYLGNGESGPDYLPSPARSRVDAEQIIDLITLLGPAEAVTAGLVRRVRTPEGEKKYGQPIGTVITADRTVKAVLGPNRARWGDLKVGDRFVSYAGDQIFEVVWQERYERDVERRAVEDFYRDHYEEYQNALVKVPRPPKASGKVLRPVDAFKILVGMDPSLATKVHEEWKAKGRKKVLMDVTGNGRPTVQTSDGVSDPDFEFVLAPTPEDPFEEEIIAPARAALAALTKKYPNGIAESLNPILYGNPPEPELSDELKRLLALPEIQQWRQRDLPNALAAKDAAEEAYLTFMDTEGLHSKMGAEGWLAENKRLLRERRQTLLTYIRLLPEKDGGDMTGVYDEVFVAEREHQAKYAQWLEDRTKIKPDSPEAREILADVEAIGSVVRLGIEREVTRRRQSVDTPPPLMDRRNRAQLSRQVVATLRGTAEGTKQTWMTDFDMTKPGAQRGLNAEEKEMLTESLLYFPEGWVADFDERLGRITTDKSDRGYFETSHRASGRKDYHISLSDEHNTGPADGFEMRAVAVHEVGHGMERSVVGLTALETIFWFKRTGQGDNVLMEAFDRAEMPIASNDTARKKMNPTARPYTLKWYGETVKGRSPNPDAQKMYRSPDLTKGIPTSFEVFTTGVQEVLGDGNIMYTYNPGSFYRDGQGFDVERPADTELWDLTMGALLTLGADTDATRKKEGSRTQHPVVQRRSWESVDGTMNAEEVQTMTDDRINLSGTYTRVTYRPATGRARSVYLRDARLVPIPGGQAVSGSEVDREASIVDRIHLIDVETIDKAIPVEIDPTYATLKEIKAVRETTSAPRTKAIAMTPEDFEAAVGAPLSSFAKRCHEASLALVQSGVLGPKARVARGSHAGVGGQHSWVVLGDPYDPEAPVIDPTLWSYVGEGPNIKTGKVKDGWHPHGQGSIWEWGIPPTGGEPAIPRPEGLSPVADSFIDLIESAGGPMDLKGWISLAHAPVEGWPSENIITAMYRDDRLRSFIPIDIVGMRTDENPNGLYLPTKEA